MANGHFDLLLASPAPSKQPDCANLAALSNLQYDNLASAAQLATVSKAHSPDIRENASLDKRVMSDKSACFFDIMISGKLSEKLTSVNMLARQLGLTAKQLYFIAYNLERFYTVYQIPKKNGKFRTIEAPSALLKKIQRKILKKLVSRHTSKVAMAFEKKRNIIQNAKLHLKQPVIVGLDVKDFFPSLKFELVWKYFRDQNIAREPARLIATLCTFKGHLPQGAVTSPFLANRLLREFDETMLHRCHQAKVNYSRYADDITLSGSVSNDLKEKLLSFVREGLHLYGLQLNNEKIRILRRNNRQEVTGIVVNEKLQAPRELRRTLRQKMYYLNRYWENDWQKMTENDLDKLLGQVNFVWSIDKNNSEFAEYRKQLLEIKHYFTLQNKG